MAALSRAAALAAALLVTRAYGVNLVVDWASFLARSDPVWQFNTSASMPFEWTKSMFGGNAMLGFMLWSPTLNSLRLDVGRSDLYDDRTPDMAAYLDNFVFDQPRLPIGHFDITWAGSITNASGRLSLWDGTVYLQADTTAGSFNLRVLANAAFGSGDVIVLDTTAQDGEALTVTFVPEPAVSTWIGQDSRYIPNPPCLNSSTSLGQGQVLNLTSQPHLKGSGHSTAVLAVPAGPGANPSATSTSYYITTSAVFPAGTAASDAWARGQVTAAAAAGQALWGQHASWWHTWWPAGGFLTLADTVLESFWYIQLYKFASASRAGRALHDLEGPWFIDGTSWPDLHWDMNLQQTYYLPLIANRPDLSATLPAFLASVHASGALANNVPVDWRGDASAAPTGASSLSANMSCYWDYGPNCTASPPSITGNLLWACQLVYLSGQYSGNASVHTDVLWPILDRALQAYQHFQLAPNASADGRVHLPTTYSPEYPGPPGPDANYDLSLYRWGLETALGLAQRYNLTSPHIPAWTATLDALTWYSVDAASNTFSIYAGVPYGTPHRHYSHLFMIWPLRSIDFTNTTQYALAKGSVDRWLATPEEDSQFYRPAASAMNVMLRQYAAAFDNITYLLRTRIEANTMYREGSQGACTETPVAAAWATADWLAQSWNRTTVMLPDGSTATLPILDFYPGVQDVIRLDQGSYTAAPAAVATAAFYRLGAEEAYVMSASREVVTQNSSHYITQPTFVAVEAGAMPTPTAVVVRTTLSRPLSVQPAGLTLTEVGDSMVLVTGMGGTGGTTSFVLTSGSNPVPNPTVTPLPGCPADYNFWGFHPQGTGEAVAVAGRGSDSSSWASRSFATGASRLATPAVSSPWAGLSPAPVRVVLTDCSYSADGTLASNQRYIYDNSTGVFALQDGSGRCLAIETCDASDGDVVLLVPCASGAAPPIGCSASSCGPQAQSWTITGATSTPPFGIHPSLGPDQCLEVNGAFNPDSIDVWHCDNPPGAYHNEQFMYNTTSGGIVSLDTDACCLNKCLTPAS